MTDSEFEKMNHKEQYEDLDEFKNAKRIVKHKRIERKIRKKRKKVNNLKAFIRFILLVAIIFVTYHFFKLSGWYLPKDTFKNPNCKNLEIVNNKIIPTYVINKELSDIPVSRLPIFFTKINPIKKELYKIPVIKNVYIRRYGFPARLQIIVMERTPIAIIKTDLNAKPAAFFTLDGVLITNKHYMNLVDNSSVLKILTTPQSLKKDISVKRVLEIEQIVKAVETYSNEKVEYIDMRKPNDVFVKIQTTSIRLGTLDSTVYERIKRIYTILPQITNVDSQIQYIDLSWDKVNYLKMKKPIQK